MNNKEFWHKADLVRGRYPVYNLISENVANFIDLFSNKKDSKGLYVPYRLINSNKGYDKDSDYKHISDHLFDKRYTKIPSEMDTRKEVKDDKKYDLIFADLPFNVSPKEAFIFDEKTRVTIEINHLAKALLKIKENGRLYCVLPSNFLVSSVSQKILNLISNNGFHYDTVISCPDLGQPFHSIKLVLFGFTRTSSDTIFAGILKNGNYKYLFDSFSNRDKTSIEDGLFVDKSIFISIDKLIFEDQIHTKGDYSGIPQKKLGEICKAINQGSKTKELKDGDNVVFIPKIGKSKVVTNLKDTNLKHQNLFRVELNKKYALSDYIMFFLNTDLGIEYRESIKTGGTIMFISKIALEELVIFLPSLKKQKELIEIISKIDLIVEKLKELKKNIAYNPNQSDEVSSELNKFIGNLNSFSEEEKIMNTIEKGENYFVEFKETYAFERKTNEKRADHLIHSAVKNINAFLNSKGGQLFIGVKDNGEITGLEDELAKWKSIDDFMLFFTDTVKSRIGSFLNTHIEYNIYTINKRKVLIVDCKASESKPSFIDPPFKGKDFFVRTNPAAQPLDGNDRFEYIRDRFK